MDQTGYFDAVTTLFEKAKFGIFGLVVLSPTVIRLPLAGSPNAVMCAMVRSWSTTEFGKSVVEI